MRLHTKSKRITFTKKVYQRPQLKLIGNVQQLTLKMGSFSDGMGMHE